MPAAARPVPSGEQFELVSGSARAVVVEVGAGLRECSTAGRELIDPYPVQAMCDGAHGALLIPWPNRLGGGRYTFDGVDQQLPLTEPELGNAIHGLTRWSNWQLLDRSQTAVTLALRLYPSTGYPYVLDVSIAYELHDSGLAVTTTATNAGDTPLPYGTGQHPYLSPGPTGLATAELHVAASTVLVTDDHSLPTGRRPVAGSELDFGASRRIEKQVIDGCLTDLARDDAGLAHAALTGSDGRTVTLSAAAPYDFFQLYTGDTLAPPRRRLGLAVEPMTCPANAFASGEGLIRLEPGQRIATRWQLGLTD